MYFTFEAELWIWEARRADSWTFVTLPVEASEEIKDLPGGPARGFGARRVRARIGVTTWLTSVFPESGSGRYVLPVKRSVRDAQHLGAGDLATVTVEVLGL